MAGKVAELLITPAEAEARTASIYAKLPKEWQSDAVTTQQMEGQVPAHGLLLEDISRAVPLKLLLDHTSGGLVGKSDKSQLTTSHFFLSTPVAKFKAFVSHRWSAVPREVVSALLTHVYLSSGRIMYVTIFFCLFEILVLVVYPPLTLILLPFVAYMIILFLTLTHKLPCMLSCMGLEAPDLWFDKATVHQTNVPLTQAGLSLFGHFLQKSDQLMILFQPAYLTRVWCIYELGYWLKNKGDKSISLVPLNTYNTLLRVGLTYFPLMTALACPLLAFLIAFGLPVITTLKIGVGSDADIFLIIGLSIFLVGALCVTACLAYCLDNIIVGPARKERMAVAQQMRRFEVRETQSFAPSDKKYVLGEIVKWWDQGAGQGDDAALDAFNAFIRTRVAKSLDGLQRSRENVIHLMVFTIAATIDVCIGLVLLMITGVISPLAWPSALYDITFMVTPPSCSVGFFGGIIEDLGGDMNSFCGGTGYDLQDAGIGCVNGQITNLTVTDCVGPFSSDGLSTVALGAAIYSVAAILISCHAVAWSKRSPFYNRATDKAKPGSSKTSPADPIAPVAPVPPSMGMPPAAVPQAQPPMGGGARFDTKTGAQLPKFDPQTGKQNWW